VIDLRFVREHPDTFDRALARRGLPQAAQVVLAADAARRAIETRLQDQQAERNRLSREIGEVKRRGGDAAGVMTEVGRLRERVQAGEDELRVASAELDARLAGYPNMLADDVPDGPDERANRVERTVGTLRNFAFAPRPHEEIGAALGLDLERAAVLAGARFAVLKGGLARLQRALASFMIDLHTAEHGYLEVDPPLLVKDEAVFGTGQLPKFADDLFKTTHGLWLIPTAEVPLTNLVRERILHEGELPLRLTALTPCFRSEAGAAGRDTKGILRVHQFMKVELVSITTPDASDAEQARMTACAEAVLQALELPYRVVTLCAGDTGFAARRTFDIEVWLPGQQRYREISSCSTCGDFQARRMDARFRPKGEKGTRFVHTLNGSGVAVGRALIAVLETFQEADGSVTIPPVLRPYMGGQDRLVPA
jgi:seryl-tRNA synthetase